MKKLERRGTLLLAAGLVVTGLLTAFHDPPAEAPARANKYIGASKCKSCHQAEDKGNQYGIWENAGHSRAFETLGTDAAKKIAAEQGIADPQKAPECLRCHTTAYGVDAKLIKKGFKVEQGVQCESCHGPGDDHLKARFKAAAAEDPDATPEPGEVILDVPQETCLACHNEESPTFKPFCFHERMEKIRHPRPDSNRPVMVCGCDTCECTSGCPDDGCGVPKK